MTLRNVGKRALHGKVAFLVLTLTLLTFATGLIMILAADPVAPVLGQ